MNLHRFHHFASFFLAANIGGDSTVPADENIVTWNVTNWITVVLMAAVGLGLLALAQKYIASKNPSLQGA